jgi:hypothetical protein
MVVWIDCRDYAVRTRREQKQNPFRCKARKQTQQEGERYREKNSLLMALVERTDVINLYGHGMVVLHRLSPTLMMSFIYSMTVLRQMKRKAIERRLNENFIAPVDGRCFK